MIGRRLKVLIAACVAVLGICSPAYSADLVATQAAVNRGAAALEAMQSPTGAFGDRLVARDSAAAGEALDLAAPSSSALDRLQVFITGLGPTNVDDLSRLAAAFSSSPMADSLVAQQNADGGFGLTSEYQSEAFDTSLALRALSRMERTSAAKSAFLYLLKHLDSNGGWGDAGVTDPIVSGQGLDALAAYRSLIGGSAATDIAIANLTNWLVSTQNPNGSFVAGDMAVRTTATDLHALSVASSHSAERSQAASYLIGEQAVDGSWGDPFTTALAIRALQAQLDADRRDQIAAFADPSIKAVDVSLSSTTVEAGASITVTADVRNLGETEFQGVELEVYLTDPLQGGPPAAVIEVPDQPAGGVARVSLETNVGNNNGRRRVYVALRTAIDEDRSLHNNSAFVNLFVLATSETYVPTKDWPTPGRDIQRTGRTPNKLKAGIEPTPVWRHAADGGHTVAAGQVYFGHQGLVYALNAKTGAVNWSMPGISSNPNSYRAPRFSQGLVYATHDGGVTARSAVDGAQRGGIGTWGSNSMTGWWTETVPRHRGSDEIVSNYAEECGIYTSMDQQGGEYFFFDMFWPHNGFSTHRPCLSNGPGFAASNSHYFFTSGGGYLTRVDRSDGMRTFDVKLPDMSRASASPLIDSLGQVVVTGWEGVTEAEGTQDPWWTRIHGVDSSPDTFSVSDRGRVTAVDPATGGTFWTYATNHRLDGTPVQYRNSTIVIDRSGVVYAIDSTSGEELWTWQAAGYTPPATDQMGPSGQTLVISGRYLFVPHPDGSIHTLDVRTGETISSVQFEGRPYDLAVDDTNDVIYVHTLDGYVGAYRTRSVVGYCDPVNDAQVSTQYLMRASTDSDGSPIPSQNSAYDPTISADGSTLAFSVFLSDFGTNTYVRDLVTQQVTGETPIEYIGSTQRAGGLYPTISADGRYLAYASNTYSSATGVSAQVAFVRDRANGSLDWVVRNADDQRIAARATDALPRISADGNSVVFGSRDNRLVATDDPASNVIDIFLRDRSAGTNTRVSQSATGVAATADSFSPDVSANGRFVAFVSRAKLVDGFDSVWPAADAPVVYVADRSLGTIRIASADANGVPTTGATPSISADGRMVAYASSSTALLPIGAPWSPFKASTDVYVHDMQTDANEQISVNDDGYRTYINRADSPSISADGRFVAFVSNWAIGRNDPNLTRDVYVRDRVEQTTTLASVRPDGIAASGDSTEPSISADGSKIAFSSVAADMVEGDVNGAQDVYVWKRDGWSTTSYPGGGDPANSCPVEPVEDGDQFSDLSIEPADIVATDLETGTSGEVSLKVTNNGPAVSDASTVQLFDGSAESGTLLGEQSVDPIAAGAHADFTFTWNPVGASGSHDLTVVVDPERNVFEQALANNEATASVTVQPTNFVVNTATAEQSYGADESAEITTQVTTSSLIPRSGDLSVWIEDDDGDQVIDLQGGRASTGPGQSATFSDAWNTMDSTAGAYTVRAELTDSDGDVLARGSDQFTVDRDVQALLDVSTDQFDYAPGDVVRVDSFVSNRSRNASLVDAQAQTTVTGPGGEVIDSGVDSAGEVVQGGMTVLSRAIALADAAPGEYQVASRLVDASGAELAVAQATFTVESSATSGAGLRGSITATPDEPTRGSIVTLGYSLTNTGNADLNATDVIVRIADLTTGDVVKSLAAQEDVAMTATVAGTLIAIADMPENRDYQVGLYAALPGGVELPLDRAIIHVKPVPFTSGAELVGSTENRVLVWACDPADEAAARAALGDAYVRVVPNMRTDRYNSTLGCTVFNHDEEVEFVREMRSGNYNQFWILGKHHPFENFTGEELAARVVQGDGLLVAGSHPSLDLFVHCAGSSPLGVKFAGTLPTGTYPINFYSGSAFAGLDGVVAGRLARVTTKQATAIGTSPYRSSGAITATANQYGAGRAIYIGAPPSAFTDAARAAAILERAGDQLASADTTIRAGGLIKLNLWVEGIAPGSPLEVRTELPAGTSAPQLPADSTLAGDLLTVPFPADGIQRKDRSLWLKLPTGISSLQTSSMVYYRDPADATMKPFGAPAVASITIDEDKAEAIQNALDAVNAVSGAFLFDCLLLEKIKNDVQAAAQPTSSALTIWKRMTDLVIDVGILESKSWAGAPAARLAVARLVTYLEYDYYLATGGG